MICPKCGSKNVYVANTYSGGRAGSVQRRVCSDCECVITTALLVLNTDPPRGDGAYAKAKELREKRPPQ